MDFYSGTFKYTHSNQYTVYSYTFSVAVKPDPDKSTVLGYSPPLGENWGKDFKQLFTLYPKSRAEREVNACMFACLLVPLLVCLPAYAQLNLSTFIQLRIPVLGMVTPTVDWVIPYQLTVPNRHAHMPNWCWQSLMKALFPRFSVMSGANHHKHLLSGFPPPWQSQGTARQTPPP